MATIREEPVSIKNPLVVSPETINCLSPIDKIAAEVLKKMGHLKVEG